MTSSAVTPATSHNTSQNTLPLQLTADVSPLSPAGFIALARLGWKQAHTDGATNPFPCPLTRDGWQHVANTKKFTDADVCAITYNIVLAAISNKLVETLREQITPVLGERYYNRSVLPGNIWRRVQSIFKNSMPAEVTQLLQFPSLENGTPLPCGQVGCRVAELFRAMFKGGVVATMQLYAGEAREVPPLISDVAGFVRACGESTPLTQLSEQKH